MVGECGHLLRNFVRTGSRVNMERLSQRDVIVGLTAVNIDFLTFKVWINEISTETVLHLEELGLVVGGYWVEGVSSPRGYRRHLSEDEDENGSAHYYQLA